VVRLGVFGYMPKCFLSKNRWKLYISCFVCIACENSWVGKSIAEELGVISSEDILFA